MRIFISLISLLLLVNTAFATKIDTFHIKQFRYKNSIYFKTGYQDFDVKITPLNALYKTKADDLYLKGNKATTKGIGINYKWISAEYVYASIYDYNNIRKSANINFSISASNRRNIFKVYFGNYKGLLTPGDSGYVKANGIQYFRAGVHWTLIKNGYRFSWAASNFQSERQAKSAASLLLNIAPTYNKLSSTSLLTTDSIKYSKNFGKQLGITSFSSFNLTIQPGLAINLSLFKGKIYIAPAFLLGAGMSISKYHSYYGLKENLRGSISSNAILNMGFNGWRLYFNLKFYNIRTVSFLVPSNFDVKDYGAYFTLGWRFGNLEKIIPENPMDLIKKKSKKK